jgi:hypothetical protein
MGGDNGLSTLLVATLELVALYAGGSYAAGGLAAVLGRGGSGSNRAMFYLLVFPGVVLHESAHYLACLITGTKVLRFAPFSPSRQDDGRVVLGYVRHERRAFPIRAIIGLAPIVLNPLGLLLVTILLTPLTLAEITRPRLGDFEEAIVASGFLVNSPLVCLLWGYLSLSFALGSVPSREDLVSVPAALVLCCASLFCVWLFGGKYESLPAAIQALFALVAGLYALPAAVALAAALVVHVLRRASRY